MNDIERAAEVLKETLNDPINVPNPGALNFYRIELYGYQEHEIKANFIDLKILFNGEQISDEDPDFIVQLLMEMFENILYVLTQSSPPDSYLRMIISSIRDESITPISIPFIKLELFSAEVIMNKVAEVLNSAQFLDLSNLKIHLVLQKGVGKGGAYRERLGQHNNRNVRDINDYLCRRKCLISIKERDNLCGARALLLGKGLHGRTKRFRKKNFHRAIHVPKIDAWKLYRKANIPVGRVGLPEIRAFQSSECFKEYQIYVFTLSPSKLIDCIFCGPPKPKKINLLLENEHYWVIRNMAHFYCKKNFCYECLTAYDKEPHKCSGAQCKKCRNNKCNNRRDNAPWQNILCQKCRCVFPTPECFVAHEDGACDKFYRCEKCNMKIQHKNKEKHDIQECGLYYCKVCGKFQTPEHEFCFMQVYNRKNPFQKQFDGLLNEYSPNTVQVLRMMMMMMMMMRKKKFWMFGPST